MNAFCFLQVGTDGREVNRRHALREHGGHAGAPGRAALAGFGEV